MKIVFFTPALVASAIGRVSCLVVSELIQQDHEVVVVRTETIELLGEVSHPFPCEIISWNNSAGVNRHAKNADLVVYQIGNHLSYHRGCLDWLQRLRGVVSLHDNFLGHLFWGWSEIIGRQQALRVISSLYGTEISNRFFDHADSASFIAYASELAPMTEWVASMASAVIVHSSWALERITKACPGPVSVVPLPYDAPCLQATPKTAYRRTKGIVALTIGHVNRNKRYAEIIRAIGSSSVLREDVSYRIVGPIEPDMDKQLRLLAMNMGVDVEIVGEVDNNRLISEICDADIMCCLRWPALESASASTIEAMLYGKPTLVTDTGFYRDLPDECVLKISPEAETEDIRRHLECLLASPEMGTTIGRSAQRYAQETFRADRYAKHLIGMTRLIDQAAMVNRAAERFSRQLAAWGGKHDAAILNKIAVPLAIIR